MNVFDVETKVFDTELFPQDKIADLTLALHFNVLFSQEKPLQ